MVRKVIYCGCVTVFLFLLLSDKLLPQNVVKTNSANYKISYFICKYGEREWKLNLGSIGFDGTDPTTLNRDLFMNWFYQVVERQVNHSPQSATFKYRGVVPHSSGRMVNTKKVEEYLDDIHKYINKPIRLPILTEKPELTTAKVLTLKQKLLSSYSTRFNPYNANRNTNIRLSALAIDHYILKPGEVFSFNEVIGNTTSRKGYRAAKVIVQGEYKKGIGGGICQTSSTLFNCADKAGLRIIERSTHSKHVSYVPKNRDATVSWQGKDFKFQNQLNEPILIVTTVNYNKLVVSIYGPEEVEYQAKQVPSASF